MLHAYLTGLFTTFGALVAAGIAASVVALALPRSTFARLFRS